MPTVLEALTGALAHQQAGRLAQAEGMYREVLAQDPHNVDALHLLGMTAHQLGRHDAAVELIERAIRLNPAIPAFHNNLGTILQAEGRLAEAVRVFERALELHPDYPEAHINLATAFQAQKRYGEAVAHYREALRLQPECAEAHNNLGNTLAALGRAEEAIACYFEAVRLRPAYAEAWVNLGGALKEQNRLEEATTCCQRALNYRPDLAEAHSNLAAILIKQDRFADAEAVTRRALELKPSLAEAHANLGVVRLEQKRLEEAAVSTLKALELKPDLAEAHSNLGDLRAKQERAEEALASYLRSIELKPHSGEFQNKLGFGLQRLGRFQEALERFEQALRLSPDLADAHINRAMAWLQMGDFERGWPEYEWRWKGKDFGKRALPQPRWDGAPVPGRKVFLHAEQGFGDTIQFARYVPLVKAASAATVIVECPPRLVPLLENLEGADRVVPAGGPLPEFDLHAPLLSLPGIFRTGAATIPARVPYLRVGAERVERQRARMGSTDRFKIGLAWSGNPKHQRDRARSIPLGAFAELARVPHTAFFSLQRGPGAEQLEALPPGFEVVNLEDESGDIVDTAAAVLNLDLVISIDSLIGHLAAALGKPVWILLELSPDWRWLLNVDYSAWYPTARLFRQSRRGGWTGVVERMVDQLHLAVAQHLLARGRFEPGWKEFEWRWRAGGVSATPFPQPPWDGSPLEGRRILLWAEQGLGDSLQFIRYAALVKRAGGTVLVECQPPLAGLTELAAGVDQVIPFGSALPDFDVHLPLQSLPRVLGTTLETIPAAVPYLSVDPALVEHWRARVGQADGFRVGLAWAGNPSHANDRNRSMPGGHFTALAGIPGCALFSLQVGSRAGELAGVPVTHLGGEFRDCADTAAAILSLDLVISVDSMVAHLAGALGKPVWTLLATAADYRWLLEREDSPWYPSMRLFRQARPGDWEEVMARVAEALRSASSR
jgi:tetratricopeptide (TPR) repeat protein